jgi:hypothetical protein
VLFRSVQVEEQLNCVGTRTEYEVARGRVFTMACTEFGATCTHTVRKAGAITRGGIWEASIGVVDTKRTTGAFAASEVAVVTLN